MDYTEFKKRFNINLNVQQEAALKNTEGQTLLLAVPGSGKTTTLVCRTAYMIYVRGIAPENILVLTYTNAAAEDMRKRYMSLFGREYAGRLRFKTINSICNGIVIRNFMLEGITPPETLADNYSVLFRLYWDTYNDFPAENDVKAMQREISRVKNMQYTESYINRMTVDDKYLAPLYGAYKGYLTRKNKIDFDDQLVLAHDILTNDPEKLNALQDQYPYILVDEAQDTSKIQHSIIRLLASKYGNLFMVGDEDQSIYGFRAAYPSALLNFGRTWPHGNILKLEQNYRSTPEIVAAANRFIRKNANRIDKNMFTERPSGKNVRLYSCAKREEQYKKIAANLLPRFDGTTAILYRNNDSAVPMIAELMKQNIPFRCRGMDDSFFTSRTVRDLTNIMKSVFEPYNPQLFMDTYSQFNARIRRQAASEAVSCVNPDLHFSIWNALAENFELSIADRSQIRKIASELAAIRRTDNAKDAISRICSLNYKRSGDDRVFLFKTLAEPGERIMDFLRRMQVMSENIKGMRSDYRAPLVLSTVHSSKGLEYDNVLIIDEVSPVFPGSREYIEEERRLFYVAMTRARNELVFLTYMDRRQPFIESLSAKARSSSPADEHSAHSTYPIHKKKSHAGGQADTAAAAKFRDGVRVRHKQHGDGTIIQASGDMAVVRFDGTGEDKKFSIKVCVSRKLFEFPE